MSLFNSKIRRRGFTIAELAAIIAVIGILATIGVLGYNGWRQSVMDTQIQNDLKAAAAAMENYRNFNSIYPKDVSSVFTSSNGVTITGGSNDGGKTYAIYAFMPNTSNNASITNNLSTPVKGLAGWWKLNSDGLDDSSGNDHNPTESSFPPPIKNGEYQFNGTNNYINFGQVPAFNFKNLTMMSWVKNPSGGTSGVKTVMGKEFQYKYRFNSGGTFNILVGPTGSSWAGSGNCNWDTTFSIKPYKDVDWYYIAVVINSDSKTATAYVDGGRVDGIYNGSPVSYCSFDMPISTFNSNNFVIGATNSQGNESFGGSLKDLRIYNQALSSDEINAIYNAGAV